MEARARAAQRPRRSFADIVYGEEPKASALGPPPQQLEPPQEGQQEVVEGCTVTHRYVKAGGPKIHYVECGKKGGHLVLLLHAFPEFWYSWLHLFKPLSDAGFMHVVAMDCRGYGWSAKPKGVAEYSMAKVVGDLLRVVDAAAGEGSKCTLVGHGWGGRLAWGFLSLFPERALNAVLLNAPHPVIMGRALMHNPKQLQKSWYIGFFQLTRVAEQHLSKQRYAAIRAMFEGPKEYPDELLQRYVDIMAVPGNLTGGLNYYRAAFGQGLWSAPPVIRTPIRALWGEQDVSMEKDIAALPPKLVPNAQVSYLPQAGHWIMWDDPARVSAEIVAFVKEGLEMDTSRSGHGKDMHARL